MRLRIIKAQPRLFSAGFVGTMLFLFLPYSWRWTTRLLVAWDCATGLYLIMALIMMARSSIDRIRYRAALQDEGRFAILALTTLTAMVSLAAIMAELATAKTVKGNSVWQHIALAGLTVFLSWSFTHTIFALHYAHEFYKGPKHQTAQGLDIPGQEPPDYWDFMYYSFIIGTACATADINITSKIMRRITGIHCVVAFFFNTTILALTVNIGAGFF